MKCLFFVLLEIIFFIQPSHAQDEIKNKPIALAVAGLTHGHVHWILGKNDTTRFKVVGYYEKDTALSSRYAKQYNLDRKLIFTDLEEMLKATKPQAVAAFGSIFEHLEVVEACAPRKIHVMVEKPLAVNMQHAQRMAFLAKQNNIELLTNFETSWYPTTIKTYQLVNDINYLGAITKTVIHDGHNGPKEIGVNKEFLNWLTDPILNGGGAIVDFGCYGANLMTYLMKGQQPIAVTAVTRQFKPEIYNKVDDEATIIVDYPNAQCIIQASWNWPFSRKDMEVYGKSGYIKADNSNTLRIKNIDSVPEQTLHLTPNDVQVYTDPFTYFADVLNKKITVEPFGLYSLETNLLVVQILDAARESARTGKKIVLNK